MPLDGIGGLAVEEDRQVLRPRELIRQAGIPAVAVRAARRSGSRYLISSKTISS